ncbi:MAG: ABC transporter substrate-binding protein [Firmicutes bacterium]|nr:ABC transporter substrate-binding protein [Bacillota bacterium]
MLFSLILALSIGLLVLNSCKKEESPGAGKLEKLVVSFPSTADLADVPGLLAFENMRAMGYEVVPKFMAKSELAVEAVVRGDAHIGNTGGVTLYNAIAEGAKIKVFMQQSGNPWALVGRGNVKTLQDLDGKKLAQHSPAAESKALTDMILATKAPNVKPQVLIIAGSDNRAQALLQGDIDASPLELSDLIGLNIKQPGNFNVLVSFTQELPLLQTSPFYAGTSFLAEKKGAVKSFIRAILDTHLKIAEDATFLKEQAPKYLPGYDQEQLPQMIDVYRQYGLWPVNGGIEPEAQKFTIDFYIEGKKLPENLKTEQIYDRSLLDEVLKEIGKK